MQQGYAFGRIGLCINIGLVCMYVCMYVCLWPKNWLFEVLPLENLSFVQSTAHSLSLTVKKGVYYARRFVQGKNFGGILLTG